jgi:nucleoside-diphosphate-sugar epimerase
VSAVRAEARSLFLGSLHADDRVLITGAGGWFGSTLAAMLHDSGHPVMLITQRPRAIDYGVGSRDAVAWDAHAVQTFAPTVVFDCAFILRDYIDQMSPERYIYENTVLTGQLLQLAALESVGTIVSVSSGAAVHPVDATTTPVADNPYGYLKREAELALLHRAEELGKKAVVARAFSLSGSLVSRPERYALSNLILQARAGHIDIQSNRPIWRRYSGLDDFFAVTLASAGVLPVVDSGGELLEFSQLAKRILVELGLEADIARPALDGVGTDDYYSTDILWQQALSTTGYTAATLGEQVRQLDAGLPRSD